MTSLLLSPASGRTPSALRPGRAVSCLRAQSWLPCAVDDQTFRGFLPSVRLQYAVTAGRQ